MPKDNETLGARIAFAPGMTKEKLAYLIEVLTHALTDTNIFEYATTAETSMVIDQEFANGHFDFDVADYPRTRSEDHEDDVASTYTVRH